VAELTFKQDSLLLREWLANTTQDWYSGDSAENFRDNYDEISPYFQKAVIDYSWNAYGYRTPYDFDNMPDKFALCFGCSYTEGVGVGEHDTWPGRLEKNLGFACVNMGISGGSSDVIVANSRLWMQNRFAKPYAVFIQIPETSREPRVFIDRERKNRGMSSTTVINPSWDLDPEHQDKKRIDASALLKGITSRFWVTSNNLSMTALAWQNLGVPVLFFTYDNDGDIIYTSHDVLRITGEMMMTSDDNVDFARDLSHNGYITSENIAIALEHRFNEVEEWRNSDSVEPQPYSYGNPIWLDDAIEFDDFHRMLEFREIKGRRPFIYE